MNLRRLPCLLGLHTCRLSSHSFESWHYLLRTCRFCPYVDPMFRKKARTS